MGALVSSREEITEVLHNLLRAREPRIERAETVATALAGRARLLLCASWLSIGIHSVLSRAGRGLHRGDFTSETRGATIILT